MHIDFTITIGQIATIATIFTVAWGLNSKVNRFLIEHEILMQWYCEKIGIESDELPTRIRRRS